MNEPKKIDLDKAWDGLTVDGMEWSCGCGTSMNLQNPRDSIWQDLVCRSCGLVARIKIDLDPVQEHEHAAADTHCGEAPTVKD